MAKRLKFFLSRVLPLILYAVTIFILSSNSLRSSVLTNGFMDYVAHGLEFFVLSILVLRLFYPARSGFLLAVSITTVFGLTDEFHQLFVAGRTASPYDLLADFIGASMILIFMNKKLAKLLLI